MPMPWCWPCCCCRRRPRLATGSAGAGCSWPGPAIFTVGSLGCALSPTALTLELFRAFQGLGGAVLFATGTPLLRAEFSGRGLAQALGAFGASQTVLAPSESCSRPGCTRRAGRTGRPPVPSAQHEAQRPARPGTATP
jgi:hypothetical protein